MKSSQFMPSQSACEWWPHTDGPYSLIDGFPDDGIEERCWVPVKAIDGPEYDEVRATGGRLAAAMAFLRKEYGGDLDYILHDGLHLVLAEPTEWKRPVATPDGNGYYVEVDDSEPCDDHEDAGCERCHGTNHLHVTHEGCPWRSCKPTDEDAVEFYVLEVTDAD